MLNLVRWFAVLLSLVIGVYAGSDELKNGIQLFETGELEQAQSFFEKFSEENPKNAEGHYYLGRIYFRKEELKKAEKTFKKAVELEPNSSLYNTWLGHTYGNRINNVSFFKKMRMAKNIKKYYEKAIALDETNVDALDGLITFHVEAPGIAGGSKDKAKKYAARLKELDKFMGYRAFIRIHNKEKKYDLVEQECKAAISEYPDRLGMRFQLGYFYQQQKKFPEAFEVFEQMIADSLENWAAIYQVGRTAALSGQKLERAKQCFKLYLQSARGPNNPSLAAAHWRLGMIYEHRNENDLAREQYKAALELDPKMEQAKKALKKLK